MTKAIEQKEKEEVTEKVKTDFTNFTKFTIEEAAEYLGVSKRTIERWKLSYNLEYRTKDYISRETRIFSRSELDRAKAEQEKKTQKVVNVPGLVKTENESAISPDLREFAFHLLNGMKSEIKQLAAAPAKPKKTIAEFKDNLLLTYKETLTYSKLSKEELNAALEAKEILGKCTEKTRIINGKETVSKFWKINRQSLEEFCRNYGK